MTARMTMQLDGPMDDERDPDLTDDDPTEHDATRVDEPSGTPPDAGKAYDPAMTEGDEANVPEGSDADPER